MADKVVVAIITRSGSVLLARRRRQEGGLGWVFPGGGVEPGETEVQAIEREVREEVGIDVRAHTRLGERVHPDTGRLLAYWICEPISGSAALVDTEELDLLSWVTPREAITRIVTSLYPPVRDHLEHLEKLGSATR